MPIIFQRESRKSFADAASAAEAGSDTSDTESSRQNVIRCKGVTQGEVITHA